MIRRHVVDDNGAHVQAIVVCFSAGTRVSKAVAARSLNWTGRKIEDTDNREDKNDRREKREIIEMIYAIQWKKGEGFTYTFGLPQGLDHQNQGKSPV